MPSSTSCSRPSCCARLKRWISSMNRIGRRPRAPLLPAPPRRLLRRSATPGHHRRERHQRLAHLPASSRASVVLPQPGGPHRIIEPSRPRAPASAPAAPRGGAAAPGRPGRQAPAAAAGRPTGDRHRRGRRWAGARSEVGEEVGHWGSLADGLGAVCHADRAAQDRRSGAATSPSPSRGGVSSPKLASSASTSAGRARAARSRK